MRPKTLSPATALPAAFLLTLIACEAEKSANPLSPAVAGPIPGVEISAPRVVEPQNGVRLKESQQPVRLSVENATTSGVRPLSYTFELSGDAQFSNMLFARSKVSPGEGGRTSVQVDTLALGRAYYWRARAEDGANTGPFQSAQFEVLPKPVLNVPTALSPVNNDRVTDRRPTLRIRNSEKNDAVGGVSYHFMIAKDQAFVQVVASAMINEGNGETSWRSDRDLDFDVTHYWRVRATDGETISEWINTQVFRSPNRPAPAPSPGPAPNPGGPCISNSGQAIVECERSKYGHMSSSQTVDFLRAVARSLNANGISGAPFGILRKSGGSSCNGYSCDIVCSGQGGGQRQWDVLGDAEGAQAPAFNGPHSGGEIRVDLCEIQ
jgi:hypothetical protein